MPLLSYQEFAATSQTGGSIREDLLDYIENLSPKDTPLYNNLGAVQVSAGYIEYTEDSLAARGHNANNEGVAATDVALTTPSRLQSIVQNVQKNYQVSGRQDAINHAGMSTMLSYQEMKALAEFKNDCEHALHRGSAVTGNTATAAQFRGFLNLAGTYFTASSGTTLTEKVFNDITTSTYTTPVNLREWYGGMFLKRTLNQFTTSVQRYLPGDGKKQIDMINVLENDVGVMTLFTSRDQLAASAIGSSGNSWIAIDPSKFQIGWLRAPKTVELGIDGDRTRKMIIGELTLITRSLKAYAGASGHVAYVA